MEPMLQMRGESRAGFSLVELLCALSVLLAATLGFSRVLTATLSLSNVERERALATEAAHRVLEALSDTPFADVLRLYDGSSKNDPGGPGTAPGANFDVAGLVATDDDADGRVGEVIFPLWNGELREDLDDPRLGMPMDLSGDDRVDDGDHGADHQLLPVLVRVAWKGRSGPTSVELGTFLAKR